MGWTYALTLGFALVYLGEHYVIDLLAGATLAEGVRARRAARSRRAARRAVRGRAATGSAWRTRHDRRPRAPSRTSTLTPGRPTTTRRCPRWASRASARCCSGCSSSPRSRSCTSCCRSSATSGTPGASSTRATRSGWPWRSAFAAARRGGYIVAVPGRARAARLSDPLARELPDHDGRAGGDAPVRRGRRGRRRADRVGAAALRDGAPRGRRADDRVPRPDLRGLHAGADRLRLRAALRDLPRPGAVRR